MKTFKELREAGRNSIQGSIYHAMTKISALRYFARPGTISGNEKKKTITFTTTEGDVVTLGGVYWKKDKMRFCYDSIIGVDDFRRSAAIIKQLEDEDIYFNTDDK